MSSESLVLLGKRIREIRVKRGLSQEKLSELCGISSRHISEMERGESNPSFQVLEQITMSLGIALPELLHFEHQNSSDQLREKLVVMIRSLDDERLRLAYRLVQALGE